MPEEEVREAEPRAIEEAGLEDDVLAAQDGLPGLGRLAPVEVRPWLVLGSILIQAADTPSAAGQTLEVGLLVLLAALGDEIELRILPLRPLDEAAEGRALEVRQMGAGEETDQIGGREDRPTINELHRRPMVGVARVTLPGAGPDGPPVRVGPRTTATARP